MTTRNVVLWTFISLNLWACAAEPGGDMSEAERAAVTDAVVSRVLGYVDAAHRQDIEWFLDFWADSDEFVIASDGDLMDRAMWEQFLRPAVANTSEFLEFEFSDGHTFVLASDAAVHTTRFRWAYVSTSGDTLRSHGSWSYVFKNFDGTWRVIHSAGTHVAE